jgi:lysozyme
MNRTAEQLAMQFEGYREKPYYCPAGILTAGYGHAFKPGEEIRPLPADEARHELVNDLSAAERSAFRLCPALLIEAETRQGAIIDFTFNLGGGRLQFSTLRRRINQRNWPEASRELKRWIYGGGRKLLGLVLRREAEARLMS